ncbi:MAG: hypothetical protein NXH95_14280 [Pseudomonadaceae bacterium]|nr:hypothetical protein [Pseudomonadaceae bacterium]
MKLQRRDADVMEGILMRLMELGVVALPVHVSLVCELDFAQYVDQIMRDEFAKAFLKTLELRTILISNSKQDLVEMF